MVFQRHDGVAIGHIGVTSKGENEKANEDCQQIARNPNNDSPDAPTNPPVNSPAPDSP